jgi:hypothetical protein
MAAKKIGRNSPCPCGSGKKFKKCCLDLYDGSRQRKIEAARVPTLEESIAEASAIIHNLPQTREITNRVQETEK